MRNINSFATYLIPTTFRYQTARLLRVALAAYFCTICFLDVRLRILCGDYLHR
jgi:hypothetical protein